MPYTGPNCEGGPKVPVSKVFVSYARQDRDRIAPLVQALEASGLEVWWDPRIAGGAEYTREIEAQLESASAVLVVWSQHSITSMWVADEASAGLEQGKLVPITIDPVAPRIGFRQLHTLAFETWGQDPANQCVASLLEALAAVGVRPQAVAASTPPVVEASTLDVAALHLPRPELTPLVGRQREREIVNTALSHASDGRGSILMFGGEPGVGKTRLAQYAMEQGLAHQMLPLTGHAYEERGAPFVVATEIIEQLTELLPTAILLQVLGDTAAEIARLVPELRRKHPNMPLPVELPPAQQQRYLFNAVLELVRRLAELTPMVLRLEDLHWADDSSIALLEHLVPHLPDLPIVMLITFRDADADMGAPFRRALAGLGRESFVRRLSLDRLESDHVADLLSTLGGPDPPKQLVELVFAETGGNALFARSVFEHLAEQGRLFDDDGAWRVDIQADDLALPESVRLVIGRRLERLSETTRKVLSFAAILGQEFDPTVLEQASELGDELLDAIDEAEAARLILPNTSRRDTRYEFSHALVRQTLLDSVSPLRRARWHLRASEALLARSADNPGRAADIARHLFEAGTAADTTLTVEYLRRAAEHASATASFAEATAHLDRALGLVEEAEASLHPHLLYERAVARLATGDWSGAAADWREALPGLEAAGETNRVTETCWNLATFANWGNQFDTALSYVERGLAAVGEAPSAGRCRLLAVLGHLRCTAGNYQASVDALDEAEAMAIDLDDPRVRWGEVSQAQLHQCEHFLLAPEFKRRAIQAIAGARSLNDPWPLASVLSIGVMEAYWNGELDRLESVLEELHPVATRSGNEVASGFYIFGSGFVAYARGDLDTFNTRMQESSEWLRSRGTAYWPICHSLVAQGLFLRGHWSEAREAFAECMAAPMVGAYEGFEPSFWLPFLAVTDPAAAGPLVEESIARLPQAGQANTFGRWCLLGGVVEASAVLDRKDDADQCLKLARELSGLGAVVLKHSTLVQKILALAAMNAGEFALADEAFAAALRQADALPLAAERGAVRRWWATMLERRGAPGDEDRASELLHEARVIEAELGIAELARP